MKKMVTSVLLAASIIAVAQTPSVKTSVTAPATSKVGKPVALKVKFVIPAGWHIYSSKETTGVPTKIELTAPKGATAKIAWPPTKPFEGLEGIQQVYFGTVEVPVNVTLPKGAKGKQTFSLKVSSQACNDSTCAIPTTKVYTATTTLK